MFERALDLAHHLISRRVHPGALVADATAGNGHDTLMLARLVGPGGRVYAFDIQEKALCRTRELLAREGMAERVTLVLDGHENMGRHIDGKLAAVMFNLGCSR